MLVAFLVHELTTPDPVVDLRVFKLRTYASRVFLMTVLGFVLYGSMVLVPIFCKRCSDIRQLLLESPWRPAG
jgi:MFS transporter, DHA2 family, multidrug resistance protein